MGNIRLSQIPEIWFKMYFTIDGNSYHDITDFKVNGMIENTKNQISLEQNMVFPSNAIIYWYFSRYSFPSGGNFYERDHPFSTYVKFY